jgi:hypothetical protein
MISQIDDEDIPKDMRVLKDTVNILQGSESSKENPDKDLLNLEINSFYGLPNLTIFVEYFLMIMIRNHRSSAETFYEDLFEEIPILEDAMDLNKNSQRDRISPTQLKNLYEQMCFLDGTKAEELFNTANLALVKAKGFGLVYSDMQRNHYLIRLSMKNVLDSDYSISMTGSNIQGTNLGYFLENFCEKTSFEEDKVNLEYFIQQYRMFCKINRIEPVLIDLIVLKNEFGIDNKSEALEYIERVEDVRPNVINYSSNWLIRLWRKIKYFLRTNRNYKFDKDKIWRMNMYKSGKLTEEFLSRVEYNRIQELVILAPNWYIYDFLVVLSEIVIYVTSTVPFLAIFLFQEIEHSFYSLRSSDHNIIGFNVYTNDVWLIPKKIYKNL